MRVIVSAVLCVIGVGATANELRLVTMGAFSLQVTAGWGLQGDPPQRVEGRGPDGEKVVAIYKSLKADASPAAIARLAELVRGFSTGNMNESAAKYGKVIQPLQDVRLPAGRVKYSLPLI